MKIRAGAPARRAGLAMLRRTDRGRRKNPARQRFSAPRESKFAAARTVTRLSCEKTRASGPPPRAASTRNDFTHKAFYGTRGGGADVARIMRGRAAKRASRSLRSRRPIRTRSVPSRSDATKPNSRERNRYVTPQTIYQTDLGARRLGRRSRPGTHAVRRARPGEDRQDRRPALALGHDGDQRDRAQGRRADGGGRDQRQGRRHG